MQDISRREFFKNILEGITAAVLLKISTTNKAFAIQKSASTNPQLYLPYKSITTVIKLYSPKLRTMGGLNTRILKDMLTAGLMEIESATSIKKAIDANFSPKEKILIKADPYNEELTNTNDVISSMLIKILCENGINPSNITVYGCKPSIIDIKGFNIVEYGWDGKISFGSEQERIIDAFAKADAVINLANLMADPIGGIRGTVINITLGIIEHPAKYFKDNYLPYIADLYSIDKIRKKIRLNILSCINAIIRKDGLSLPDAIVKTDSILMGKDAVAVDSTGFELLTRLRSNSSLPPLLFGKDFPEYLIQLSRRNLGVYHPDRIIIKQIKVI